MMTFPAEPHNKYILFNGEANRVQAFAKPHVASSLVSVPAPALVVNIL
jgi:hypothetical protein